MNDPVRFEIRRRGHAAVIEIIWDLDIDNVSQFEGALERALTSNLQAVVVSLIQTSYFDSIGVHSLLRFAERLMTTRRRLLIVAPHGTTPRRVLEIAGAASNYPVFDSISSAVESLA